MHRSLKFAAAAALSAAVAGVAVLPAVSTAQRAGHDHDGRDRHGAIRHVLLISVDGLHQSDLDWYVAHHPGSELAKLANGGAEYTNAHTSDPSDSDPGGTALMTGGDPRATGVYYDVEYNHNLYEAGTTACHGPTGADVIYDSPDDIDATRLDAGQGIPGLQSDPSKILQMTGNPQTVLNPATFPVDPKSCQPIWPHSYLKVNTMFEVAKGAGPADRVVGQAPGVRVLQRARRGAGSTTCSRQRSTALRSSPTEPRTPVTSAGPTTTRRPGNTTPTRCRRS